MYTIILDLQ